MGKIQIFLIEDNRLLRESITTILNTQPDFDVTTRTGNGNIVSQLKSIKKFPHVVLLDFRLPIQNSLSLLVMIKREYPETKVIVFNVLAEEVDIIGIVKAGGSGFIIREASCYDFINSIRKVVQGENVLPMALINSLFYEIVNYVVIYNKNHGQESIKFTKREQEIIDLISEGLCNKEIAHSLHIAIHTVKNHVHNILKKLAFSTRLQVANLSHIQKYQQNHPVYAVNRRSNSCKDISQNGNLFPIPHKN